MNRIIRRSTVITVRKEDETIISETLWLDNNREYVGEVYADIHSLEILDAWVDVLKSPIYEPYVAEEDLREHVRIKCDFPKGTHAFIDGKKETRKMRVYPYGEVLKYLMDQCIDGVIQAETYFYGERGFSDKEAYNRYWDRLEEGGCRMYSYPDTEDQRWMDYVPQIQRAHNLFHRLKTITVCRDGAELICNGDFCDSYHEMCIELSCMESTGIIQNAKIDYYRAPGKSCFENKTHAAGLLEKDLYNMNSQELVESVGLGEGCYHLVNILKDIQSTVKELK